VAASTARTAKRLSREERREHFLDVAAELIVDKGIDSVTMESVAAAAGVSKGLGYAYFTDRSDLLMAVLNRETHAMERRIALAGAGAFEDKIRAGTKAWFDTVSERGTLFNTLLGTSQIRGTRAKDRKASVRRWEGFYADLAERELGVPRRQADIASAILISGLSGVVRRWVDHRDSRRVLEDTYVEFAIGGLRALVEKVEK
jgi:AcrR family transcriptional regulator